jgi:bacterioferritin-associated ferredoxin
MLQIESLAHVLVGEPASTSPEHALVTGARIEIDAMIVCSCNRLSDGDVRRVASGAARALTAAQVYDCLGCGTRCGRCVPTIKRIMQLKHDPESSCRFSEKVVLQQQA